MMQHTVQFKTQTKVEVLESCRLNVCPIECRMVLPACTVPSRMLWSKVGQNKEKLCVNSYESICMLTLNTVTCKRNIIGATW